MIRFFKASWAEMQHVVWPTHIETKKFFWTVTAVIAGMALFTYVLTVLMSNSLFGLRSILHPTNTADITQSPTVITEPTAITTDPITTQTAGTSDVVVTPTPATETPAPAPAVQ